MTKENMQIRETVVRRIKEIVQDGKETRKINQTDLSKLLGIDKTLVSRYCSGERVANLQTIYGICKVYGVSADYILGLSDAKTNDKDLQAVCDYVGLSAEAVRALRRCKFSEPDNSIEGIAIRLLKTVFPSVEGKQNG